MFWPCETRTSTCRSFATISSGLYRFLAIAVLLDVKDIPQVGPLQWGWINSMDARDLKNWRKRLSYNQFDAAKQLGVRRASIQNWEQELWPIPRVVELATHQIMRRWKRRREFGPVLLIYTEEPIWQQSQRPYQISILHSAVCANNKTAMQHVERLKHDPGFINPVIMESNGEIIWTTSELLREAFAATGRARRRGVRSEM